MGRFFVGSLGPRIRSRAVKPLDVFTTMPDGTNRTIYLFLQLTLAFSAVVWTLIIWSGHLFMKFIGLSVVLFLLAATFASAQKVHYNFAHDVDFSKFKTYKWVSLKDAATIDPLGEKQIKSAIDSELAKKGLSKTEGDEADLYVGYQAAVATEKQLTSYDTDWGYGPGWYGGGWYGGPGGMTTGQTSTIYVGQLAADMGPSISRRRVAKRDLTRDEVGESVQYCT